MNNVLEILKNFDWNYAGLPIGRIIVTILVLSIIQALRRFLVSGVIKSIERLTRQTKSNLDDELVVVLKPSLSWLILIGGIWFVKNIWAQELGPQFDKGIDFLLGYIVTFIIAYFVYRCASVFGQFLANVVLRTDTELDELLRPPIAQGFSVGSSYFSSHQG
ncbi:MAG: hypothetical protein ACOYMP_11025 [Nodosilinea sp.]